MSSDRRTGPPPVPAQADPRVLPGPVQAAVSALGGQTALVVGQQLAAAALLVDSDPVRALAHAQTAKERAPRLAEAREAVGVCAYAAGEFLLARNELRAVRRMSGAAEVLPLLADCERALGQPERAIELAGQPDARRLSGDDAVELALVVAGARRDLGQYDAALAALRRPEWKAVAAGPLTVRLWYAYADTLAAAGRGAEAAQWFARTARADEDGDTDAEQRLADYPPPAGSS